VSEADRLLREALSRHQQGELETAAVLYDRVLAARPDHADALHLLGVLRYQQKQLADAVRLIGKALELQPGHADYLCNLSAVLRARGDAAQAESAARRALESAPDLAAACNALGGALQDQSRFEEALAAYVRATSLDHGFIEGLCNAASLALDMGDSETARGLIERLRGVAPALPLGLALEARLLESDGNEDAAAAAWRRALDGDPRDARFHCGLAALLERQRRWDEALEGYLRALALDPNFPEAINGALYMARSTCSWDHYPALAGRFLSAIEQERTGLSPFVALAEPIAPSAQLICARTWSKDKARRAGPAVHRRRARAPGPAANAGAKRPITVAYLTSEFRRHPTAYTKVGLFEHHDRTRFRVIGYCNGEDDGSEIRQRIVSALDEFVDLRGVPAAAAASRIREDRVDILIDLKGHTENALTECLALHPAPVQASWVGFPGSTGADFIDYAIVDRVVVPEDRASTFSESLIWMPDTYWAEDDRRAEPGPTPTRAECGLPDQAVVLACFNNSYKIHPDTFSFWMDLLKALPAAVLWLQDTNPGSRLKDNLRLEMTRRGVDPQRLVFCPRLPLPDYLARYRLADLFIDTLPYNAHTTAADALWAGLPVLTLPGPSMASRVAASLLHAANLGDLVAATAEEYRSRVVSLARDPDQIEALKERVRATARTSPLFDTARFTRNFESALEYMVMRSRAGLAPASKTVAQTLAAAR
jgi:predicted O-linked N-acetylglucosamine transferase (SPINDLY family)